MDLTMLYEIYTYLKTNDKTEWASLIEEIIKIEIETQIHEEDIE